MRGEWDLSDRHRNLVSRLIQVFGFGELFEGFTVFEVGTSNMDWLTY